MHRVPWSHDPERDTCTELDGEIARGQGQWVFIVSMVDPEDPTIRAFFEADNSREADVMITEDTGS
jgi:deoxyribodipyrimidine photolyase